MGRRDVRPREEVLAELDQWLRERNVRMLGNLGFENAYALAMPRAKAAALGVRTIADLAQLAPRLSIAGDYEFFARPEWAALREAYGLRFRAERQMQPDFMYQAAAAGDVDVVSAYTSEGLVAKYDLLVLEDPKRAIPPYDAILLVAPRRADDETLAAVLMPLVNAIDVEKMRAANLWATTSSPEEVARWLAGEIQR
jgi:osmoprotectant transport system permease protein